MKKTLALFATVLAAVLNAATPSTSLVYVDTTARTLTGNIVAGNNTTISASGNGTITATAAPLTGITGLGTGVSTFLATPSSANLASAVTNETGSGALVFATSPTLVTPVLGAATGTSLSLTGELQLGNTYALSWGGAYGAGIPLLVGSTGGGFVRIYPTGTTSGATATFEASQSTFTNKVGIGTSGPSDLLSLEGSDSGTTIGAGTVAMRLVNTNAAGLGRLTEIHFGGRSQSAKPFAAISAGLVADSSGEQSGNLSFSVKDVATATNPVEAMRLFGNGNLFIGASPSDGGQKLQVSGTIAAGGGVSATGAGIAGFAEFSHASMFGGSGYALAQNSSGATFLNAASGQNLLLRTNGNITALTLDSSQNATFAGTKTTFNSAAASTAGQRQNITSSVTAAASTVAKKVAYIGPTHSLAIRVIAVQDESTANSAVWAGNFTTAYGGTASAGTTSAVVGNITAISVAYDNGGSPNYTLNVTLTYTGNAPVIYYTIDGHSFNAMNGL